MCNLDELWLVLWSSITLLAHCKLDDHVHMFLENHHIRIKHLELWCEGYVTSPLSLSLLAISAASGDISVFPPLHFKFDKCDTAVLENGRKLFFSLNICLLLSKHMQRQNEGEEMARGPIMLFYCVHHVGDCWAINIFVMQQIKMSIGCLLTSSQSNFTGHIVPEYCLNLFVV